jgi:hypothetical protein
MGAFVASGHRNASDDSNKVYAPSIWRFVPIRVRFGTRLLLRQLASPVGNALEFTQCRIPDCTKIDEKIQQNLVSTHLGIPFAIARETAISLMQVRYASKSSNSVKVIQD